MSNVIIGIVGVILFIGLAIAGASFLGPRFVESTAKSKASAVMQANATIAGAVQVRDRELQVSTPSDAVLEDILHPNYIGEMPRNPAGGAAPILVDASGAQSGPASFVIMEVAGTNADEICNAISRQGGGPAVAPRLTSADIGRPVGCFRITNDVSGQIRSGDFIAYATIY